jgi:hypothetical protein
VNNNGSYFKKLFYICGVESNGAETQTTTTMTNSFELLKNGKVATAVWANPTTKEIYPANRNSFGWNAQHFSGNEFFHKYGKNLKTTQGRVNFRNFFYSAKSMESVGFKLVLRGDSPLWT